MTWLQVIRRRRPRWTRTLWWKLRAQAFGHWRHGYAWSPLQRCRQCRHTTPYHYAWCEPKKAR